jgi:hypothetical protein
LPAAGFFFPADRTVIYMTDAHICCS